MQKFGLLGLLLLGFAVSGKCAPGGVLMRPGIVFAPGVVTPGVATRAPVFAAVPSPAAAAASPIAGGASKLKPGAAVAVSPVAKKKDKPKWPMFAGVWSATLRPCVRSVWLYSDTCNHAQ